MFWIAVAAHILFYIILGVGFALIGRRFLPPPLNEMTFVIPATVAIGIFVILATLPHWHLVQSGI